MNLKILKSSKTASEFLFVWARFESGCFKGSLQVKEILAFVEEYQELICEKLLIEELNYFHKRYHNCKDYYRHLKHKESNSGEVVVISNRVVANSHLKAVSKKDKLVFLIYLLYRYRNNMFHGNKRLSTWLKYDKEIRYCIHSMIKISDAIHRTTNNVDIPK